MTEPEPTSVPGPEPAEVVSHAESSPPVSTPSPEVAPATQDVGEAAQTTSTEPLPKSGRIWAVVLSTALVAGLISFAGGEAAFKAYEFSPEVSGLTNEDLPSTPKGSGSDATRALEFNPQRMLSLEEFAKIHRAREARSMINRAVVGYAGLGAALGLGLGLAGALLRGFSVKTLAAPLVGLALGGLAGAGISRLMVPIYRSHMGTSGVATLEGAKFEDLAGQGSQFIDLKWPFLTHGAIWVSIGLSAGLALGLALGHLRTIGLSVLGGVLGAVGATILYEVLGAILFPLAETPHPVPIELPARLFAHLSVAILIGAGAVWSILHLRMTRAKPAAPAPTA